MDSLNPKLCSNEVAPKIIVQNLQELCFLSFVLWRFGDEAKFPLGIGLIYQDSLLIARIRFHFSSLGSCSAVRGLVFDTLVRVNDLSADVITDKAVSPSILRRDDKPWRRSTKPQWLRRDFPRWSHGKCSPCWKDTKRLTTRSHHENTRSMSWLYNCRARFWRLSSGSYCHYNISQIPPYEVRFEIGPFSVYMV